MEINTRKRNEILTDLRKTNAVIMIDKGGYENNTVKIIKKMIII